jgi:integrase
VFVYVGRLKGEPNVRTITLEAASKTDAIAEVESLRAGVREHRVVIAADRKTFVRDAIPAYREYLESLAGTRAERSPRTLEGVESKLRLHVVPVIGHLRVAEVREAHINEIARRARKQSRSHAGAILSVTAGLLAWAVREKMAASNAVDRARAVYGDELLPDKPAKQARALSDLEIARALEHVSETFMPIIVLKGETGFRISELLGLTWSRLDFELGTVEVAGQLYGDKVRATKTKRKRTVPLSAKAIQLLRRHRETMRAQGHPVAGDAFVFVTTTGAPQHRRNVLRAWTTALEKIGVDADLHALRHTFVSRLAERNVPVVAAQELVGHANPAITQAVYTRLRGAEAERIEALRQALESAAG